MAQNFAPLQFPPGVVKGASNALAQGSWNDAHLVRWIAGGSLLPVGGWEKLSIANAVASKIRAMHTWLDNSGVERTGILCEKHVYILEGGVLTDISPTVALVGPPDDLTIGGYGNDAYNADEYGTARSSRQNVRIIGPAWTVSNWGEDLLLMSSYDGRLLRWQPSAPTTPATAVPNAPVGNRTFIVTPERYVVIFQPNGASNKFQWCDQEDIETWAVSVTTTAGFYEVQPFAPIVSAKVIKNGFVFFTTVGPYFCRYIGVPYVYSYDPIAGGSIPTTSMALMEAGGKAYWHSEDGFWSTDGLSVEPVPCGVFDWLKDLMDTRWARYRMSGVTIGTFQEIWWFFPENENTECTRYVCYNFVDNWWSMGKLARTCGASATFSSFPTMTDGTSLFKHESGWYYSGVDELPYAETGAINSRNGAVVAYVDQMIVDHGADIDRVLYTFKGYLNRTTQHLSAPPPIVVGPKKARADGYLDARITARDLVIRIQTAKNGLGGWSFGQALINAAPRGPR